MLDDLREDADFVEEDEYNDQKTAPAVSTQPHFLGMTPVQRFVIALFILMMVCILGSFFLLITDMIWLPF